MPKKAPTKLTEIRAFVKGTNEHACVAPEWARNKMERKLQVATTAHSCHVDVRAP